MPVYLLDTNVVLRLVNYNDAAHNQCQTAVETLINRGDEPCLAPQVLVEFWAVATRPTKNNGFGWDAVTTKNAVEGLRSHFSLRPEGEDLFEGWFHLVTTYSVSGKRTHDARLAAFVTAYGFEAILTLNPGDFNGWGIRVIEPSKIIGTGG